MIEVFTPSTEKQLNRYNNTSGNIDKRVMSPVITVLEEVAKISAKEYNAMTPKQRESAFKKAVVIAIKNDIKFQSQLPKRD